MKPTYDELLAMMSRLADDSESAVGSEPDMPSHETTMDQFDRTLEDARNLIARAK